MHALINAVALGLYAGSLATRSPPRRGLLLRSGAGLLCTGGWLGDHLAYALGVGVDTTAFQKPPADWTDACQEEQLRDNEPLAVTVADTPVMLLRQGYAIRAIGDRCTHRGAPLHEGTISDGCIQCPWHGSRFALTDGAVRRGPATRPQPVFDVRVLNGRVQVRRSEQRTLRLNPTS